MALDRKWRVHNKKRLWNSVPGDLFQAQNYANLEGQDGTEMQILRMDTNAQKNSDRKQLDEARMDG